MTAHAGSRPADDASAVILDSMDLATSTTAVTGMSLVLVTHARVVRKLTFLNGISFKIAVHQMPSDRRRGGFARSGK